jgi:hypothetical protein
MKLRELQRFLADHPDTFPRFVLPDGDYVPVHAHVTEVGHVIKKFIDCGGVTGQEEKALLQTHVGEDTEHRLRADRLSKILELGGRVLPNAELDVDIEYDCCVVAQYPIAEVRPGEKYLDLILQRGRTQCRAHERRTNRLGAECCSAESACC